MTCACVCVCVCVSQLHIPFALGAIGVFHSVAASELGEAKELDLNACLLAKIFSGQITHWNDPEILADNPTLTADGEINVVHRVSGSSSTAGFTEYLTVKCPTSWVKPDGDPVGSGSTIDWLVGAEAEGSGGMTEYIQSTPNAIGYIDVGHGHAFNLVEVKLQNKEERYLSSQEADIGAAAVQALNNGDFPAADADWSAVNLYDKPGNDTWPITMVRALRNHAAEHVPHGHCACRVLEGSARLGIPRMRSFAARCA